MVVNVLSIVLLVGGALFAIHDFQANAQLTAPLSCNEILINGTRPRRSSVNTRRPVSCRAAVGCEDLQACRRGDPTCVYRCKSMSRLLNRQPATLKDSFVMKSGQVERRRDCFQFCDRHVEVLEIVVPKNSSAAFTCRCSRIRGIYLRLFRSRYLAVPAAGLNNEIYARVKNTVETGLLLLAPQPVIFYALDSVSGGVNLGTLGREGFSAKLNESNKGFTCPWVRGGGGGDGDQGVPSWRPKLLRMNAADRDLYQLQHNGLLSLANNTAGYTVLIWSRQDERNARPAYLMAGTTKGNLAWVFGHQAGADQVQLRFEPSKSVFTSEKRVFTQRSWNNFAFRAQNSTVEFFLNDAPMNGDLGGPQTTKVNVAGTDIGDTLLFGLGRAPTVHTGCLGHLMIFNRRLSEVQIDAYNDIIADDFF